MTRPFCEWVAFVDDFATVKPEGIPPLPHPAEYSYGIDQFPAYVLCQEHIALVLREYSEAVGEGVPMPPISVQPL